MRALNLSNSKMQFFGQPSLDYGYKMHSLLCWFLVLRVYMSLVGTVYEGVFLLKLHGILQLSMRFNANSETESVRKACLWFVPPTCRTCKAVPHEA